MDKLFEVELWRQLVVLIPLGLLLVVSAITDLRERKVYNKVTYPAFFVGLITHTVALGLHGLLDGLLAAVLTFVLGLMIMITGWIKGGDIKLFIAVGAFLGLQGLGEVIFYSIFAGGIVGIVTSLLNGYLAEMLKKMWGFIKGLVLTLLYKTKNLAQPMEVDERSKMPFAVAILMGGVCVLTDEIYGLPGFYDWYWSSLGF
jgi:prepilin peptidase CpaA